MADQRRPGTSRRGRQLAARVLRNATHCAICGGELDKTLRFPHPLSPSADHEVPWSVAPHLRYDIKNLRPTHLRCNQRRGAVEPPPTSREW